MILTDSCLLGALCLLLVTPALGCVYHDYCVIGAGPSGLQLGYFLGSKGRDYVIFERNNTSGSFFELYPRHRKLISINKRHTGQRNVEFNLRHDWNSLLSDNEGLFMTQYSKNMFPHADELLKYLNDYQRKLNIKVQFNTNISDIHEEANETAPDGHVFKMKDQRGQCYTCRTLTVATGMATPNLPDIQGLDLAMGYEDVSIDPEDFEGKSVLILGRGNAAFEVANSISRSTNRIHMIARERLRLAWATHYVGDVRAVNSALLDNYQLKSLTGLLELGDLKMKLVKDGNKFLIAPEHTIFYPRQDNLPLRKPYDVVIRALGFTFDPSLFNNSGIVRGEGNTEKFPAISHNYESVSTKGLFYAGACSHSLDFRKSAGGFIHGFRYTARALHRLLEYRYEGIHWPTVTIPRTQLINRILKRINEASGTYQMFQVLGDIVVSSPDGETVEYLEDYPIHLLHQLPEKAGINVSSVLAIVMQYGQNFSAPGNDVFQQGRATGSPSLGHMSNFLHPVLYFYKSLPTEEMMTSKDKQETLPKPDMLHHVVEDFHTRWDSAHNHIMPLRRFLENMWDTDLRAFYAQSCLLFAMSRGNVPDQCERYYLAGRGLYGAQEQLVAAMSSGLMGVS